MVRSRLVGFLVVLALAVTGCGIPRDPDGTLQRARDRGELIVGASASPPTLVVTGDAASGPEADLINGFARREGLRVRWVPGGEEQLVRKLEHGDIDLLVGGLTEKTPWESKVGVTRPWTEDVDEYGEPVKRIVGVPLGENALVTALERYFDERKDR